MTDRSPDIRIEVYQHDWIPGFAAFADDGSVQHQGKAHVVVNLGSLLCAVANQDIPKSDVPYAIAESIMHEVMHALEAWAGVEFSEERVEGLIEKYQDYVREQRSES